MEYPKLMRGIVALFHMLCLLLVFDAKSMAVVPSRIVGPIDVQDTVLLRGNTSPKASAKFDRGRVDPGQPLGHMYVVLARSPEQERNLSAFNERQYDQSSPDYHHWLSPEEFGLSYGPNDSDIASVSAWLKRAGFKLYQVSKGRIDIEFSGTAAQVQDAFKVEMHRYAVDGGEHISNDRDPQIPRALSTVVRGIAGLSSFPVHEPMRPGRYVKRDHKTGQFSLLKPAASAKPVSNAGKVDPEFTYNEGSYSIEFVTAYDFATIYNSLPLWNASTPIVGTGVKIAIVGDNDVNLSDVATYRKTFGLPVNTPTIVYVGSDPGGSSGENTLDLEMAGAAAPGASLTLVVPENGLTIAGLLSSASYIIDNNVAPIMSASYGECELYLGQASNAQINSLWQQGATQGISIFISAGDQGSAGCSDRSSGVADTDGLAVNGLASSPYVTAVGGTDFNWSWVSNGQTTYWNASNDANGASAKGYIPEMPWNINCANPLLQSEYFVTSGTPLYASPEAVCNGIAGDATYGNFLTVGGGSGGYSNCTGADATTTTGCTGGYAKPSWQTGTGVPADGKRDLPDVALFASYGFPDYENDPEEPLVNASEIMWCYSGYGSPCVYSDYEDIVFQGNGGTSAASPYWAGILALVVQKQGGASQGLVNPTLYKLASNETLSSCASTTVASGNTCVFYDIAAMNNAQACTTGDPNCVTNTSGDQYGILSGYNATTGYDLTTGLGSVNITNLINGWSATSSSGTLSVSPTSLSFASTAVNSTSTAQIVTLKNTGSVAVTIKSGGITFTGTNATSFGETTTCGSSLAVGASCTVSVTFKPTTTGSLSAKLSIADNASGSPQTVALTGTGGTSGTPAVKLSTTSVAFGNQAVETTSASQTVTVTNSGTASLSLTSIALTGTEADDFLLSSKCGSTLAASASCTFNVAFKPAGTGAKAATVSVTDNASGSPQTVALTGTGGTSGTPAVKLSTTSVAFGNQAVETTSASQTVTVTNSGTASLSLTSIALTGTEADDFLLSSKCGSTLAASASCTFNVAFKPAGTGAKAATVSVTDNASGSPQTVALTGTGGTSGTPAVKLSTTSVAFGNQAVETTSASQTVTVTNSGTASLSLTSIALTGTEADDFLLSSKCGSTLAASASCTFNVAFKPAGTGAKAATVSVTDNASGSPQTVALTGTGQ